MEAQITYISFDCKSLDNVLTELAAEIPPEFAEQLLTLLDASDEFVCLEGVPTGANELTVTLQPSDALLQLASAVRAGKR